MKLLKNHPLVGVFLPVLGLATALFSQATIAATATVPGSHATLQAAVSAVQGTPGALVTVNSNATFAENVLITSAVSLVAGAGFSPTIRPAAGDTVTISPNSASAQTFTLRGLQIQSGGANSTSLVSVIANGTGAVTVNLDQVQISNPLGGVGNYGVNLRNASSATTLKTINVTDSSISINTAINSGANAIFMAEGGALSVARSTITTTGGVSAFDIRGSDTQPITFSLVDSTFNIAAPAGPYSAISMDLINDVTSDIRRNTFNFIGHPQGSVTGILIRYLTAGRTHTITQNKFIGTASRAGSALNVVPFAGGFSGTPGPQSVTAVFTNNVLRNLQYGIQANPQTAGDTATLIALNNTIHGAGLCLSLSANRSTNITGRFNNNLCTEIAGAVIPAGEGPSFVQGAVSAFADAGASITTTFSNNGYFNNPNGNYSPTTPGVASVGALITSDPRYADPAAGDLRLSFGSPAIDNGLTEATVTIDHSGAARPVGAAYDIGAFEGGVIGAASSQAVPALSNVAIGLLVLLLAIGAAGGFQRRGSASDGTRQREF